MADMIDRAAAMALCDTDLGGVVGDYRAGQQQAHAYLKAAIAALPAQGVMWQSFDTAPRDGSRILAKGGGLDDVDICSYNARVGCWNCGDVTLDDTDHEPEGYNRPTLWMSLAALAPAEAGGVEAQERAKALTELAQADAPLIDLEPHVNEAPKSEHDAGNVLKPAPVDALVKAAAKVVTSYWQQTDGTISGIYDLERALAAIREARNG